MLMGIPFTMTADDNRLKVAQTVLNDLYLSNGNHIYLKPSVAITNDNRNAALFLRRANKIELSQRLFDVCSSFGKDSLAALAFVLGHELAHVFQHDYEIGSTSFLVYDKMHEGDTFYEESADVLGIFMAFLAGYDTRVILSELIAGIYEEFGLDSELRGYPSLEERQNTIEKVHKMSSSLIDIYEGAAFLVSIGKYDLAAESYAYVERWYKGKEIYNNIGICKVQEAMNIGQSNLFPFVLPFEVQWTTRMSKPLASRGPGGLSGDEKRRYDNLLDEAIEYFSLAAKMDPTEVGPEINHLCALILKGESEAALQYSSTANLGLRSFLQSSEVDYETRLSCVRAIAYHISGEKRNAIALWNKIIQDKPGTPSSRQAAHNLATATENAIAPYKDEENCAQVSYDGSAIDRVRLHRPMPEGEWVELDSLGEIALCIDQKQNSSVYTFKTSEGYFSMQRVTQMSALEFTPPINQESILLTDTGYISACLTHKLAFRLNEEGALQEWVKYY